MVLSNAGVGLFSALPGFLGSVLFGDVPWGEALRFAAWWAVAATVIGTASDRRRARGRRRLTRVVLDRWRARRGNGRQAPGGVSGD
ncbi:hypothetical protein [Streptomyces collinus]|uniref:hypothetical protein n=1 Tax=Streptomyces collinus TaxID=42684 RepID=UPI0036CC2884